MFFYCDIFNGYTIVQLWLVQPLVKHLHTGTHSESRTVSKSSVLACPASTASSTSYYGMHSQCFVSSSYCDMYRQCFLNSLSVTSVTFELWHIESCFIIVWISKACIGTLTCKLGAPIAMFCDTAQHVTFLFYVFKLFYWAMPVISFITKDGPSFLLKYIWFTNYLD